LWRGVVGANLCLYSFPFFPHWEIEGGREEKHKTWRNAFWKIKLPSALFSHFLSLFHPIQLCSTLPSLPRVSLGQVRKSQITLTVNNLTINTRYISLKYYRDSMRNNLQRESVLGFPFPPCWLINLAGKFAK
jgi:hypothetical protein